MAGVLLACNPLSVDDKPAKGSFTAQGDGFSSKTSLSGTSIIWSDEDAIKVFNGSTSEQYVIESGQGSSTAVFTGNEIEGETYYAVYPYSAGASLSAGVITATVPATQYGVVNSFDKDINLAVACSNNHTLQFKNVCGYLRLQIIDNDINTIVISSNSGAALAGEVAIGFDGAGNPVVNSVVDGSSSVTLTPKTGTSFSPGVYIVAVLPGTYTGGITVNMTKQHAKEDALQVWPLRAQKTGSSNLTVNRSAVKTIGIVDKQLAWECLGQDDSKGVPVGPHNSYSSWGQYIDYQSARTFCAVGAYNYSTILDACFAYSSGFGILSTASTQASTLYNSTNIGYIVSTAAEKGITLTSSSLDYIENWTQENSLTTLTTNFISLTSTQLADDNAYNALSNYSALRQVYLSGFNAHKYNNNTLPISVWGTPGSGNSPTTGAKITTTGNYYAFKIVEGDDTYFGVFKITTYNASPAILKFIYKIACSREGTPEAIPE